MTDIEIFNQMIDIATISKDQLAKITERLPEYHRASSIIGHSHSQSSITLQTLTMMDDSPLSRMKQCISQINKRYQALREAYFKIEKMKLEIITLSKNNDELSKLEIREKDSLISTISVSMENSLREIGMFQDMYESIRVQCKISKDWTEKDYEEQEIQNMIRKSFRLAIQDIMSTGRVSKACVEYWEQLGIHPSLGALMTENYLNFVNKKIADEKKAPIKFMYDFLDQMANNFKDVHKEALKRIGLDEIGSEGFMAKGVTKPQ